MFQASQNFDAQQAQIARDYNTQMANTSYQRGVKDMQAAGLNPMLAYSQGGAATPTSSAPTVSPGSAPMAGGSTASTGGWAGATTPQVQRIPLDAIGNSALDMMTKKAAIDKMDSETSVNQADVPFKQQLTNQAAQQVLNLGEQFDQIRAQTNNISQDTIRTMADSRLKDIQGTYYKIQSDLANHQIQATDASARLDGVRADLADLQRDTQKNISDWAKKTGTLDPALDTMGKAVGTATGIAKGMSMMVP
jgi:hypothetical protein